MRHHEDHRDFKASSPLGRVHLLPRSSTEVDVKSPGTALNLLAFLAFLGIVQISSLTTYLLTYDPSYSYECIHLHAQSSHIAEYHIRHDSLDIHYLHELELSSQYISIFAQFMLEFLSEINSLNI